MSVIKKLKENTTVSVLDLFTTIFPNNKSKYYELFVKLFINEMAKKVEDIDDYKQYIISASLDSTASETVLNKMSPLEISTIYSFLNIYDGIVSTELDTLLDFINLNERNLIEKNDLTTYTSFNELSEQVSLGGLKENTVSVRNETDYIFEDDNWLVLRPLSSKSSIKYGYNTKWCTAMVNDITYFRRYAKDGILIYILNKQTGYKVAVHKKLVDKNLTFWNQTDESIDSIQTDLTPHIIEVIKNEIKTKHISNYEILLQRFEPDDKIFEEFNNTHRLKKVSEEDNGVEY